MKKPSLQKPKQKVKETISEKTPERFKNPSELQVRIRTGAVYIGISIVFTLISPLTTVILLCVLAGFCAGELCFMLRKDSKLPNELISIVGAVCYPMVFWLWGANGMLIAMAVLMLALLVWYVFYQRARVSDVGISYFCAAYPGMTLAALIPIRVSLSGIWGGILVVCIFLSIWGNDAFAYLVGSKFGKHKMAPRISPKKSWEGFFGGLVGCVAFWCLMVLIPGVNMSIPQAIFIGICCGLFGVLGDLAESRIKRNTGVKDSGTIMPGHGGLLDRNDSLFLSSVISALLLIFMNCIPYVL